MTRVCHPPTVCACVQLRGSTIICRKGDIMSADDLRKVSVEHAQWVPFLGLES